MALEAGVRGKAGWLALRSRLEGLLSLASVPSTSPLCLPKVLHSVLESQLLVVIVCVCVNLSTSGRVCLHTRVYLFLAPSCGSGRHFWFSVLSPAASVPQPQRGDARGCPLTTPGLQGQRCPDP